MLRTPDVPTTGRERTLGDRTDRSRGGPPQPLPPLHSSPLYHRPSSSSRPCGTHKKTTHVSFQTGLIQEINNIEIHSVRRPVVHRVRPWRLRLVWSGSKHGRFPPRDDRSTRNRRLESFSQTPAGSVDARGLTGTRRQTVVGLQGPVGADF